MTQQRVRTRFAPSPTGFLHIGGVRTALLNYLFAKSHGGDFIVRIEDTDRTRYVEGAEEALIQSLTTLGLRPDEGPGIGDYHERHIKWGPYRQSERLNLYNTVLEDLIEEGVVYPCFCDREKVAQRDGDYARQCECYLLEHGSTLRNAHLAQDKNVPWRLFMPRIRNIRAYDEIRGATTFEPGCIGDPIIMKSDGYPTYHFAVVVDDHFMDISHVLRGDEWMATWPIHIYLYEALGWEQPKWIHLPPVLGKNGKKLSKRDGSTNVEDFLAQGFLPEAIINYLAFVGCSFDTDKEVLSISELVALFDPQRISTGGGVFDVEKLRYFNREHLKVMDDHVLTATLVTEYLVSLVDDNRDWLDSQFRPVSPLFLALFPQLRERIEILPDVVQWMKPVINRPLSYEKPAALNPKMKRTEPLPNGFILEVCRTVLNVLPDRAIENPSAMQDVFRGLTHVQAGELKFGDLCAALRMAITGKVVSLPLFEIMSVLGRDEVMERLSAAIKVASGE